MTPQVVARSITGAALESAREGWPVHIFSKYDKNTNTAVKGIVTAQRVLAQRHDLAVGVTPSFRTNRNEVTLKVEPIGAKPPHVANPSLLESAQNLSVARATDPKVKA